MKRSSFCWVIDILGVISIMTGAMVKVGLYMEQCDRDIFRG